MPLTTNAVKIEQTSFGGPFRIILSGSSGAGKTYFAEKILKSKRFDFNVDYIYYFHPCYLDETPVNWHETMTIPVSYQTGLPTLEQMMSMPPHSVIVLDDLMEKCILNDAVDKLFRVISGKRKISVMIMTQNYFAQGRFGRNIRNCCNYTVLLRNCCDATINRRATLAMGLTKPFDMAVTDCFNMEYPYVFIDQTQQGQVSGYQVYTNIFDQFMKVYSNKGMPSYIIPEKDFLSVFNILQIKNRLILAQEKNENEINDGKTKDQSSSRETTENACNQKRAENNTINTRANDSIERTATSKSASIERPKPYSRRQSKRARRLI